jgi:N-glycosidase YbiA
MPDMIEFYNQNQGAYGCFSNFAAYSILLHGKTWPTSEHCFQAQKFAGTAHEEEIRLVQILLSTRNALLVGHTRNDSYWADGGDGSGLNRLGHLLMELRAALPSQ